MSVGIRFNYRTPIIRSFLYIINVKLDKLQAMKNESANNEGDIM